MISTKCKEIINDYKYMIFDLDGTLIDSMSVWANLGFNYLSKNNIAPSEKLKEALKVRTIPQAAEYFITEYKLDKTAEQIIREVVAMIDYKYKYEIPLKPFVKEFLEKKKNDGTKMCVATASDINYVSDALKRLKIFDYFEYVLSCSEHKLDKSKPDIFYMATEKMGGDINSTIVFEDALHAIRTAKSGGFKVVGVYEKHMKSDYEDIVRESDYYINSFEELL